MSVTVKEVASALNLDDSDNETLLSIYLDSAINFIKNAIGQEIGDVAFYTKDEVAKLFDTAVITLTGTYYTYRIAVTDTQSYQMDYTLNSIVGRLS